MLSIGIEVCAHPALPHTHTNIEDVFTNRSLLNFVEKEEERWKERKEEKGNKTCICIRPCEDARWFLFVNNSVTEGWI